MGHALQFCRPTPFQDEVTGGYGRAEMSQHSRARLTAGYPNVGHFQDTHRRNRVSSETRFLLLPELLDRYFHNVRHDALYFEAETLGQVNLGRDFLRALAQAKQVQHNLHIIWLQSL